jgi:glutamine amidotransferase
MIGIIDYGAGNLLSVKKALEHLKIECRVIDSKEGFKDIDRIILPGVGAFGAAMQRLRSCRMLEDIREWVLSDKPFLGICLGMQLLFEESDESRGVRGFGIFEGKVVRFKQGKVPQIGWNQVSIQKESCLLSGIDDLSFFYFLHGYFVEPKDTDIIIGTTEYGVIYPSMIKRGSIHAVQFHPEKSGVDGLRLLENWVRKC